jgi:hypothetical protein
MDLERWRMPPLRTRSVNDHRFTIDPEADQDAVRKTLGQYAIRRDLKVRR